MAGNGDMVGRQGGQGGQGPSGPPPKGHEHAQGENMTNGVPDTTHDDEANALPHSEREASETAAGKGDADG